MPSFNKSMMNGVVATVIGVLAAGFLLNMFKDNDYAAKITAGYGD